jgi:hypothetical protein
MRRLQRRMTMADPKPPSRPTYTAEPIRSDTGSAVFLGNPHLDNLTTVVIALGAEIWSDRQRLRIVERVIEQHGRVSRDVNGLLDLIRQAGFSLNEQSPEALAGFGILNASKPV